MKKVSQGSELTGDFPDTAPEPRSQNSETYFLRAPEWSDGLDGSEGWVPGRVRG